MKTDSIIAGVISVILATVLGGIAAFLSIGFFEGSGYLQQLLGISFGDESGGGSWQALAFAPLVAGMVCAVIYRYLQSPFCGLADTILAAREGNAQSWRSGVASIVAAFASFSLGASVGQYGAVAHLGGFVGGLFRHRWSRGVGLACGVAAAIAAAFNAPVTGILFAHEVILRRYSTRDFAPVAVSSVVGYLVSVAIFERPAFLIIGQMEEVLTADFFIFALQGLLFGLLAVWYMRAIFLLDRQLSSFPKFSKSWGFIAAGGLCGGLWLLSPESVGGRELIMWAIDNSDAAWHQVAVIGAVKAAATILCLGAGFAGGIVSPTLAIGALAGILYAAVVSLLGVYEGPMFVPVICGMVAFTAPVIGAPLAGILLVLELSGGNYPLTITASLAIALSFSVADRLGGRSYYERQIHSRKKHAG